MCVIIHKPANVQLCDTPAELQELLQDARQQNSDGFGIQAWHAGKLVQQWKGTDTQLIDEISYAALSNPELEVVAHWRLATHGEIIPANCHPFSINHKLSFFHNGILGQFGAKHKSDTLDFVEKVLQPQFGKWRGRVVETHAQLLAQYAATGQRFAVTNHLGKVWRFGEWIERDGVWFSNNWLFAWEGYAASNGMGLWQHIADDDDWEWDAEKHEYRPNPYAVKYAACECFGDICGTEHDPCEGCDGIAEIALTIGSGKASYNAYSCAECAWLAGIELGESVREVEVGVGI